MTVIIQGVAIDLTPEQIAQIEGQQTEVVVLKTSFKVGDRVRVLEAINPYTTSSAGWTAAMKPLQGKIGTITNVNVNGNFYVKFGKPFNSGFYFDPQWIELAPEVIEDEKLIVGKTVFAKPIGSYNRDWGIIECKVSKIGKKYFYVDDKCIENNRFFLSNMLHDSDTSPSWKIYLSIDIIKKEDEDQKLLSEVSGYFRANGCAKLSVDQLTKIKEIIFPTKP